MKKSLFEYNRYFKWIDICIAIGLVGVAFYVIHDMQIAQGVGYYFALKLNASRPLWEGITDFVCFVVMLLLILIPCILLGYRRFESLCRFTIGFFAFCPSISMAYLLNVLGDETPNLWQGMMYLLHVMIPFFLLLLWATKKSYPWKKWYTICLGLIAAMIVAVLCVASLQQLLGFVSVYLLLVICFDFWEKLYKDNATFRIWGCLLFSGLLLRAVYMLLSVSGKY